MWREREGLAEAGWGGGGRGEGGGRAGTTAQGHTGSRPPGAGRSPHVTGSGGGAARPALEPRPGAGGRRRWAKAAGPAGRRRPTDTARVSEEGGRLPCCGARYEERTERGAGGRGPVG